jgi:hypothetical protein
VLQNHTNAIYAIAASGTHQISVLVIQKWTSKISLRYT